jgi:Flp pilus assembly protein TadG
MSRVFLKRVAVSGLRGVEWLQDDTASQIVEFAFSLPLIAFFVIGIFDFSQAYGLKQKLINAAREGARIGASQPTQDLTFPPQPPSVTAIVRSVGQYLQTVGLNDCGLASVGGAVITTPGALAWTYTANGCPGFEPTVEVERGVPTTVTISSPYPGGGTMYLQNTRVTVTYPYTWKFGSISRIVVPGSTFSGPTTLQAVAMMQNLN